jgi:hypothetical protein
MLKNTIQEIRNFQQNTKPTRGGRGGGKGHGPQPGRTGSATLLVKQEARFMPTQFRKNIGMWNEQDDDPFMNAINENLNRLADANMDEIVQLVHSRLAAPPSESAKMTPEDRQNYVKRTLVRKASLEPSFSGLYAEFTRRIGTPLKEAIISDNEVLFYDCMANARHGDNSDEQIGTARFMAELAKLQLIPSDSYIQAIVKLIERVHDSFMPLHVEMFKSFVINAGQEVARDVEERANHVWELLDRCLERKSVAQRLHFALVDVKDKLNEWFKGIQKRVVLTQAVPASDDERADVRAGFSSFMDRGEASTKLTVSGFVGAAMDLYQDQTREYFQFCEFICGVLGGLQPPPEEIAHALIDSITRYKDARTADDAPKLWPNTADLLYLMLVKKILPLDLAKRVRSAFPDLGVRKWAPDEGMKWFLNDHHYYSAPVDLEGEFSREIRDALMMPATVENPPEVMPMSRTIVVALLRSVMEKLPPDQDVTFESFAKWRHLLALAVRKVPKAFRDELTKLVDLYELPMEAEQLVQYVRGE